jgi:transcriptional regulator with XRE-family HTH domain
METSVKDRVAQLVRASGRKAKPFSKLCGLSGPHVGMILRGDVDTPDQATLQKIAIAARCSLSWLMLGAGDPPTDTSVREAFDALDSVADDPRPSQAA